MDEPNASRGSRKNAHCFELSVAGLKRTPGACVDFRLQGGFASGLATGLVEVPPDRDVIVEGRLESVGDGILASGTVRTTYDVQCSRCLTPFTRDAAVEVQELFVYAEHAEEFDDEEAGRIHDEAIDLEDLVRDAIILDQPLICVCREECLGLCPQCGADLNADPGHDHGTGGDTRWLTLAEWGRMS
ncbi:MAG: YceD family protein [Propionibacteriaceae bacterium]|nr:YceD family protein [Propionibacteriaceae bacterium]